MDTLRKTMRLNPAGIAVVLGILLAGSTHAQVVRTWVSALSGNDLDSCTRSAPCRNFSAAINAVDAGGEVVVLDSGGYGPVVIDKSVSMISPLGIHAAIAPTAGSAIHVIVPGGSVLIRGIYLNSQGASMGVNHVGVGTTLQVESTVVSGFSSIGIAADQMLVVTGSEVRRCGLGMYVLQARALVTDTLFLDNPDGGLLAQDSNVSARDCGVSGSNAGSGFDGQGVNGPVILTLENCFATRNGTGFGILGNAGSSLMAVRCVAVQNQSGFAVTMNFNGDLSGPSALLTGCTVTQNETGLVQNDPVSYFRSPGDNFVFGNGTDISGVIVPETKD